MDRTATLGRTRIADDQKNQNRLRVPVMGIVSLSVAVGAKASKSHHPPTEKEPSPNSGTDDFHFAPGVEDAKIAYEIDDPLAQIDEAVLELFARHKTTALWTLELKTLGPELWKHGKHELTWDGRVVKPTTKLAGTKNGETLVHDLKTLDPDKTTAAEDFPDGYITLKYTPYKLKLTIKSKALADHPVVAWTYVQVLVKKIELELGPEEAVPATVVDDDQHKRDKAVRAALGSLPAKGAEKKVYLESNLFKKGHSMFDNSLHDEYKKLWGDGPNIPVFAKVTIANSLDAGVDAPKALGKVAFLWDWESKASATSQTFADDAADYDKDKTKPKGLNCHADRGGKRGDAGKPVFPVQAGYDAKSALDAGKFPFKVEACADPRKWAACSYAWREGAAAGKTGVVFQPSRMAGDKYVLTVYCAYDVDDKGKAKLNVDTDAPLKANPAILATSGTFIVWRMMHLRKYYRKTTAAAAVNIGTVAGYYSPAFVEIENVAGTPTTCDSTKWNSAFATAISGSNVFPDDWWKAMLKDSTSRYGDGPYGVYFKTRAQFRQFRIEKATLGGLSGLNSTWTDHTKAAVATVVGTADLTAVGARDTAKNAAKLTITGRGGDATSADLVAGVAADKGKEFDEFMKTENLTTDAEYAKLCERWAKDLLKRLFDDFMGTDEGCYMFQVKQSHNMVHLLSSICDGEAADFASGTDRKCGFLFLADDALYGGSATRSVQTTAHEFGHHFFLPHPKDTAETTDYKAHDEAVSNCIMSYVSGTREVCGLCRLRMRGWDKSKLDPDGSKNKKT